MIITNCKITKMDKSDPRYPAPDAHRLAFTDIYLCQCETDEGPFECAQFVTREATPDYIGAIIMCAGAAIKRMGKPEIAEAA